MHRVRAFFSVLSAAALLLSSLGFSVSRHYCLDMLAAESFYHLGDESCGMEDADRSSCDFAGGALNGHCCEDENLSIPGIMVQERENDEGDYDLSELSFSGPIYRDLFTQPLRLAFQQASSGNGPPPFTQDQNGRHLLIRQQRFLI